MLIGDIDTEDCILLPAILVAGGCHDLVAASAWPGVLEEAQCCRGEMGAVGIYGSLAGSRRQRQTERKGSARLLREAEGCPADVDDFWFGTACQCPMLTGEEDQRGRDRKRELEQTQRDYGC